MYFSLVFETAPFDHSGTPPHGSSETTDYIMHPLGGGKPGAVKGMKLHDNDGRIGAPIVDSAACRAIVPRRGRQSLNHH